MRRHERTLVAAPLTLTIALALMPCALAAADITDIGTINGRSSIGIGVNNAGDVAGFSFFTGTIGEPNGPPAEPFLSHAVLFSGGVLRDLGALEGYKTCSPLGCQSMGFEINDSGWIVGANDGDNGQLAMAWLPQAVPGGVASFNVLPGISPLAGSVPNAINNLGQMVGRSSTETFIPRAVRWRFDPGGPTVADLGTLRTDGAGSAMAYDINDLGQIVGGAADEAYLQKGFLYLPAPAYGLPAGMNNLMPDLNENGHGVSINNKGEVVGEIDQGVPWVWLPAPAYGLPAGFSLLTFTGKTVAFFPAAISDSGQIMGEAYVETNPRTHDYVRTAAAWRSGRWFFLDDLLPANSPWKLTNAVGVANVGKTTFITGGGWRSDITDVNGLTPASHGYLLVVSCTGDLDDDGDVDAADQKTLMSHFGQTVPPGTSGDLNGDGVVNQQDVRLLVAQIHGPCI